MLSFLLATLLSASASAPAPAPDCRIGAYRLDDGSTVDIGPDDDGLRWRRFDGTTGGLARTADGGWTSTLGRTARRDGIQVAFSDCAQGGITFAGKHGRRIAFDVQETMFEGEGGIRLAGRLVLPEGDAKVPVLVLVHGAESYSARVEDDMQRQLPAEGLGAFVYDKRGTGGSQGKYTQDFSVLANDAVAAMHEARRLAGARAGRIGYRGGSQGGWVAPLAATRAPVDFVVVAYGLAVSVLEEDREAVVLQMKTKGHDQATIDKALEISDAAGVVFSSGFTRGLEAFDAVRAKYRDAPWYKDVRGNFTHVMLPLTQAQLRGDEGRAYVFGTPFHYDPRPVLRALKTPQLWILAEDDMDAPSAETLRRLHVIAGEGAPITTALFPDAGHGMLQYETAADGTQTVTRAADGYMRMTLDFARDGRLHGRYGDSVVRPPDAGRAEADRRRGSEAR